MSRLSSLDAGAAGALLDQNALGLKSGPFIVRIGSDLAELGGILTSIYADSRFVREPEFSDFHVQLRRSTGLRRWVRPQVRFEMDGIAPFFSLPCAQTHALFEWGLNWCVASHAHRFLILHGAVLARGDRAVVLPAPPGSGKSTLTAALAYRGWRLLSDELTLIDPQTGFVHGLARPVSLKNESIDVIARFLPEARLGPVIPDTKKGAIAFLPAPVDAIDAIGVPARIDWVIAPRFKRDAHPTMTPVTRPDTFRTLIANAFNYNVHGRAGFDALGGVVGRAQGFVFEYGSLNDAIAVFDRLAAEPGLIA